MSVCDIPGCEHLYIPQAVDDTQREDLEEMLSELKGLRLGARGLIRSGNPEVRAEGEKALMHIEDQIHWIRGQLSKGESRA